VMRAKTLLRMMGVFFAGFGWAPSDAANDPVKTLVGRLDQLRFPCFCFGWARR